MSQTLKAYFEDKPRLEVSTQHLKYNKKLRRAIAASIEKLHDSTSKVDLATKVIEDLSNEKTLKFLFTEDKLKALGQETLVYQLLEVPVTLACETFTGMKSKSMFEAQVFWWNAQKKGIKMKHESGQIHVHLASEKDKHRVYVTDPSIEVAVVDNISPMLLLDKSFPDRHRLQAPRKVVFVKLNDNEALMLFHSFGDDRQRRICVPIDTCKSFTFKPISEYSQIGLQIEHNEMFGSEFDVNHLGEVVGEKRTGRTQKVWVLDITNRGRKGDQGPKGPKGERGKTGAPGKSGNLHVLELLSKMKFTGPLGETEDPSIAVQFYRALSTVAERELERQKKRGAK